MSRKSFLLLLALLLPVGAQAEQAGTAISVMEAVQATTGGFSEQERGVLNRYLSHAYETESGTGKANKKNRSGMKTKQKKLPPGLVKKLERGGGLPPGWQNKVQRGEVLDPVYYERGTVLPNEVLQQFPSLPAGTEMIEVDGQVIRILETTREVVDIFGLVL